MNFRNKYVLAIDQGTTSSRAILFSHQGNIITLAQKTFQQYFPKPGWVEHDPNEIWYTQSSAIKEAMAKADVTDMHIACIGIANQRETTIIWDRETGFPVYNAIVWQDRRTADYCEELKTKGYASLIQQKTGLVIDAYFSATKIRWILDHVKGVRERAALEGICYQVYDVLMAMENDIHAKPKEIRVDGGAIANNFLMQFQADICRCPVVRPRVLETTALGAAYLAGLAIGYWKDVDELKEQWSLDNIFSAEMHEETAETLLTEWHKAVGRSLNWAAD